MPLLFILGLISEVIIGFLFATDLLQNINKRTIRLITTICISFFFGVSWGLFFAKYAFEEHMVPLCIFSVLLTAIFTFISIFMLWKDGGVKENEIKGVSYAPNELIGIYGTVLYTIGGNKYCGKLDDDYDTQIIVTSTEPINGKFKIVSVSGGDIIAADCQDVS